MDIEIIDRLKKQNEKPLVGIQLIGCLQSSTTFSKGAPNFSCVLGEDAETWVTPYGISKIERVFSQDIDGIVYDVMIVHRAGTYGCLFIGKWNDGVWTENP